MKYKVAVLILAITMGSPLFADVPMPQMLDTKEYRGGIAKSGDLYIAGQPLVKEALHKLKAEGVTTVINLRTDKEMNNHKSTPIDEKKILADLGINYVRLPSGGAKNPYNPATLASFANALEHSDGKVLLHCNSAIRATPLLVADLVTSKGIPLAQALAYGTHVHFGQPPIGGYLQSW